MQTFQPLISVLIPSYNHRDYIEETIDSIWQQPYRNIEIVVVDDCSTDASRALLKQLEQRSPMTFRLYMNEKNRGVVPTINSAVRHARGEFVVLFASDDLFAPDRFQAQLDLLADNPALQIVYGNGRVLEDGGPGKELHKEAVRALLSRSPEEIQRYLYTHTSPFFLQTALIRKSLIEAVGGFDEDALADDWLMNTKFFGTMKSSEEFAYVDQHLVYYRMHGANVHKDFERQRRLKLQFVDTFTPAALKPEAYSNIHFDIARLALKSGYPGLAWKHYRASQRARLDFRRMTFVSKIVRRSLACRFSRADLK